MILVINTNDLFKVLQWRPSPSESRTAFRDSLLIHLLASSGLRLSEAINLKDVNLVNRENRAWLDFFGKCNIRRQVPIANWLTHRLSIWARDHSKLFDTYLISEAIEPFNRLHTTQAWKITRARTNEILGYPVRPHLLRHSIATFWIRNGVNIRVVQSLLGHQSLGSTARYLHCVPEELVKAVDLLDSSSRFVNLELFSDTGAPGTPWSND
jgi:site-specific recombinase XerD